MVKRGLLPVKRLPDPRKPRTGLCRDGVEQYAGQQRLRPYAGVCRTTVKRCRTIKRCSLAEGSAEPIVR